MWLISWLICVIQYIYSINVLKEAIIMSNTQEQRRAKVGPKSKKRKAEETVEAHTDDEVKETKPRRKKTKRLSLKKQYPDIKNPRSAFQIYISEISKKNKSEGNNVNATEITPKWSQISDEEKAKYYKFAEEDVVNWLKQVSERGHVFTPKEQNKYRPYLMRIGVDINSEEENNKLIKKRPTPAFFIYTRENRSTVVEKNKDISNKDVLKILGEQWRGLTADQKQVWEKVAQQEA